MAVVEGAEDEYQSYWEQTSSVILDKIYQFLVKKKMSCLTAFEYNVWSEVHRYEDYNFDKVCDETSEASGDVSTDERWNEVSETRSELRKFRNKIYARIQCSQNVDSHMKKYNSLTKDLIERFDSELSVAEVETLENQIQITKKCS